MIARRAEFTPSKKPTARIDCFDGGPNVIREEHFFRRLIELDARLEGLGIVEVDGVMAYIDKEDSNV